MPLHKSGIVFCAPGQGFVFDLPTIYEMNTAGYMVQGLPEKLLQSLSSFRLGIQADGDAPPSYWTVEGMHGHEYSVAIFFFMLAGVILFAAIVYRFFKSSGSGSRLKFGEKILFLWIVAGLIVAVVIGALQLLYGRLI